MASEPAASPKGEDAPPTVVPVAARSDLGSAHATDEADARPINAEPLPPEDVELHAADGTTIYGRHYRLQSDEPRPLVLLFHQAGSNAAEYEPIAPRLGALGFEALAIDQRSGGRKFGHNNHTVSKLGKSTGFSAAYPDLEAAVQWARRRGTAPVVAWGSSYTAALVFRLCAEHGDALAAVLAFSPGEYLGRKGQVAQWAEQCPVPVFITSSHGDEKEAAAALASAVGTQAQLHVPRRGVHGSSTLRPERNAAGMESIWAEVERFLEASLD